MTSFGPSIHSGVMSGRAKLPKNRQPDASVWHPPATIDSVVPRNLVYDYEFQRSASTLPPGWAWISQNGASYKESDGCGQLTMITASGYMMLGYPIFPYPFTVDACFVRNAPYANYYAIGLWVAEQSSGAAVTLANSGGSGTFVQPWTSNTASGSGTGNINYYDQKIYMQMVAHSATDWDFKISGDGVAFFPIVTGYNVSSTVATPSHVGFGGQQSSSDFTASILFFRVSRP